MEKSDDAKTKNQVSQKHIDGMVEWVVRIVDDLGPCTIESVAASADKSYSWAAGYLRRGEKRDLLVKKKGRPVMYKIPSQNDNPDPSVFEETGKNVHLTIYVDESLCNKFKALAILRKGSMYGGQGQLITMLVEQEFEKIPESSHDNLAKLIASIEEAEELKSSIPVPVEWSK